MHSDSYYLQKLIDQVATLHQRLLQSLGEESTLTKRASKLIDYMQKTIASSNDNTLSEVFELSLLPSLNQLLVDANYHLKLRKYNTGVDLGGTGRTPGKSVGLLEPPRVPAYLPQTKPEYDEQTKEKIEFALEKLKELLSHEPSTY